jgi:hypothetical protein
MVEWSRAKFCDVVNLFLGTILFFSPWLFSLLLGTPRQTAAIAGLFIAVLSIAALTAFALWEEWLNLIAGLCLIASCCDRRDRQGPRGGSERGDGPLIGVKCPNSGAATMIEERDISVAMRDGTRLAVDVYRPDAQGRYPVLYASALHNKDIQGPDIADILPPQPAHAPLWFGPIEAGDTRRFIANGYVHVIAQPRGSAKSEGHYGEEDTDHYDLIEQQPWSNGKVGMVGISGYAGEQWRAEKLPPGEAIGARDLQNWAYRRRHGAFGSGTSKWDKGRLERCPG